MYTYIHTCRYVHTYIIFMNKKYKHLLLKCVKKYTKARGMCPWYERLLFAVCMSIRHYTFLSLMSLTQNDIQTVAYKKVCYWTE